MGVISGITPWLVPGWVSGVVILSVWNVAAYAGVRRLKRKKIAAAPAELCELVKRLGERMGIRRVVAVWQTPLADSPLVIGFIRPVILLPVSMATEMPMGQLEALLAHELAHIRRHDYLVNLFQTVVETLLFYHPAVWWVSRRIRAEREQCCDDVAVAVTRDRGTYVRALAAVANIRTPGLAAGATGGGVLLPRLRRLLGMQQAEEGRGRWAAGLLALMLMIAAILVMGLPGPAARAADPQGAAVDATIITGMVVDEGSRPVPGAVVFAQCSPQKVAVTAGSDGRFSIALDPMVNYVPFLTASSADGGKLAYFPRPAGRSANTVLHDVRLTLKPAREFKVSVFDGEHHPVAGAQVIAGSGVYIGSSITTDERGTVTLRVPADAALSNVAALKVGVGFDYVSFLAEGRVREDPYHLDPRYAGALEFTLNGTKPVKVRIIDRNGKPVEGARVGPWYFEKPKKGGDVNLSGMTQIFPASDAQGRATIDFIPSDSEGTVSFLISKTGFRYSHAVINPAVGDRETTITLDRLVPVMGRVVGAAGEPSPLTIVHVSGVDSDHDSFIHDARTKKDGTFAMDVDPNKSYQFVAEKLDQLSPPVRFNIDQAAPTKPVELRLETGRHITGYLTAGPDNKPLPDKYVTVVLDGPNTYAKEAPTDRNGKFEFWATPGDYSIFSFLGTVGQARKQITITAEAEQTFDLHFDRVEETPQFVQGRVVLQDKPEVGVKDATIDTLPVTKHSSFSGPKSAADANGNFQLRRIPENLQVFAFSPDKKLAGSVHVNEGEEPLTIPVAVAASASGRLVDKHFDPVGGQQLMVGIDVPMDESVPGGPSLGHMTYYIFRPSTDKEGNFTIDGLIPGYTYTLIVYTVEEGRRGIQKRLIGFKVSSGKSFYLGDFEYESSGK